MDKVRKSTFFVLGIAFISIALFVCLKLKEDSKLPVGKIKTSKGEILFRFYEKTPKHTKSFLHLASAHYWDSLTFNRVVSNFVIQGGCPDTKEGFSKSPYLLDPEFDISIKHTFGAVGAGRDDNPKMLSAGCQFYIVQNRNGLPKLDGKYTVFGQVFKGMDVVNSIAATPVDSSSTPVARIPFKIEIIYLSLEEIKKMGDMGK